MKWIGPLFKNAGGWEAYVACENDCWYLDREEQLKIGEGKSGVMLLPILQQGYGENYATQISILRAGLLNHGQDPEKAFSFPFIVPVLTAYRHMHNWANEALNWLPDIQLNQDSVIAIYDCCYSSTISQKVRHKTIRFIKQWSKESGVQLIRPKY